MNFINLLEKIVVNDDFLHESVLKNDFKLNNENKLNYNKMYIF